MLVLVLVDVVVMAGVWTAVEFAPSTPVTRAIADEVRFVKDSLRADQLRRQVANTDPFVPPADGRITAAQLRTTLEVWKTVDPDLDKQRQALWATYWTSWPMDGRPETADGKAARRVLLRRSLAIDVQAMPAQVSVLNRHHLSLAEYEWLKGTVIEAFGQKTNEDIARMVVEDRATIDGPPEDTAAVLERGKPATGALGANVALLAGYDEATNYLVGSMVGF